MNLSLEFHCHTQASHDSLVTPEKLVATCRRKRINRVVVTDHNTIAGAKAAKQIAPELVIVGEEIMTTRGELLAAFVTEEIPAGLAPKDAIHRLREQGAFISVSHPFDAWRSGAWKLDDLLEIAPLVDAVEIFNARSMIPGANRLAKEFALEHGLPGTAGSDAHTAQELGRAVLVLPPFEGPDGLRVAIKDARVRGRMSPFWVHFYSRYASQSKQAP